MLRIPKSSEDNSKKKGISKKELEVKKEGESSKKWQNLAELYLIEFEVQKNKISGNLSTVLKTNLAGSCLLTVSE